MLMMQEASCVSRDSEWLGRAWELQGTETRGLRVVKKGSRRLRTPGWAEIEEGGQARRELRILCGLSPGEPLNVDAESSKEEQWTPRSSFCG